MNRWTILLGRSALSLLLVAVLLVGAWLRVYAIDWIPGINGDEAWCGYQSWAVLHAPGKVSWLTPTGPPISPTYTIPQAIIIAFAGPVPWTLRAVAIGSSILLLGVALLWFRPTSSLSERSAFALLLWALPTNAAFSRFGWYTTQSCLACYITLVLASRAHWLGTATAMFIALLVHPTNIFILPMVFCLMLERATGVERARVFRAGIVAGLVIVLGAGLAIWRWPAAQIIAKAGLKRLTDASEMQLFGERLVQFLSGTCVYRYLGRIELPASFSDGRDLWTTLFLISGVSLGLLGLLLNRIGRVRVLAAMLGCLLSVVGFYLVAGNDAIKPFHERYALCLIPVIGWALMELISHALPERVHFVLPVGSFLLFIAFALDFRTQYLDLLETKGHNNHESFRAYRADPKWAAFEAIQAWRVRQSANLPTDKKISDNSNAASQSGTPTKRFLILADTWWTGWPIRYFAASDPSILVVDTSNFEAVGKPDPSAMDAMVTFSHDNPGSDWLELEVPLATNQRGAKILRIYVRRR